ncbi:MAG: hypothetical protein ACI9R3_002521 [Verrucomicrobiales bacterium]|jgi:hypothetical protein
MRSGSTLLQHILHQHPTIKSYSDLNSLLVLPPLICGVPMDNICVKPMDLFFLGRSIFFRNRFDRFVWITRDPRDSYVSSMEYKWASASCRKGKRVNGVATGMLKRWKRVYRHYFKEPDRWHLVRYEDLATHPKETTGKLLDYLGLPPANVLEFDQFKGLGGGDMKLRKENTVHRKSVYRFRKTLTLEQQQVFTDMIAPEMEMLGYNPEPQVTPGAKPSSEHDAGREKGSGRLSGKEVWS